MSEKVEEIKVIMEAKYKLFIDYDGFISCKIENREPMLFESEYIESDTFEELKECLRYKGIYLYKSETEFKKFLNMIRHTEYEHYNFEQNILCNKVGKCFDRIKGNWLQDIIKYVFGKCGFNLIETGDIETDLCCVKNGVYYIIELKSSNYLDSKKVNAERTALIDKFKRLQFSDCIEKKAIIYCFNNKKKINFDDGITYMVEKDIAKLVGKDWFNYIVRAMYYFTNNNEYLNNINKYT